MSIELEIYREQRKCIAESQKNLLIVNIILSLLLALSISFNFYLANKKSEVLIKNRNTSNSTLTNKVK